ncbi:MAG: type I restriction enzyme HsdR N-terminal domain-containing protein [Deltaproteobacteria bacterium]|nr:type I restriction enzyme HsdR N-terminal domain-containing protein [Deltaproteobacteria bacterium]
MASIPRKVEDRLIDGLKRFQPILASARARDVNEADTVVIVTDLLADLLGYDKYTEITREYAIRGTICDLAIKLDDQPKLLIEVKAIGLDLRDQHVKQAIDYAANKAIDWAILTNGATWRVYRVIFAKPVDQELVVEFDLTTLNPRSASHLELLYPLTRDGMLKAALQDYHAQRQAMSRFSLAALLLSEPMLKILRRELRRLSPEVSVDIEEIRAVLADEVLKREVVEGEKAEEARKKIQRMLRRQLRTTQARTEQGGLATEAEEEVSESVEVQGEEAAQKAATHGEE